MKTNNKMHRIKTKMSKLEVSMVIEALDEMIEKNNEILADKTIWCNTDSESEDIAGVRKSVRQELENETIEYGKLKCKFTAEWDRI